MKKPDVNRKTKDYFWRTVVFCTAFSIVGLVYDSSYTHDDISMLQSQYTQRLNDDRADDIRLSIVETKQHHGEHVHTPDSICICVSGGKEDFRSEICSFGEECDESAELACEKIHI